ncbi:MAG: MotA/TolQ/ExbB proton channel family protein [Planctomycetes bacterium]|nr:MotA/TolQ/ExbB proton channel family protein [Planctomycetota bacterium]
MSLTQIYEANGLAFTLVFSLLSLASVGVVIWRVLLNVSAKSDLPEFLRRLDEALAQGGPPAAMQMCDVETSLVAEVFKITLQTGPEGKLATRDALRSLIELDLLPKLNFLLPVILVFAKLAPMLGLLGTVWGMILAFGKIAGATRVEPSALANDIGMALFTTAEGLLIAIPLIFAYTMLRERVGAFELDLQRAAESAMRLVPRLARQPGAR